MTRWMAGRPRGVALAGAAALFLAAGGVAAAQAARDPNAPPRLLQSPPTGAEPGLGAVEEPRGAFGGEGAVVIDPRTGQPRFLNAPPPEAESDRRARARLRAAEEAALRDGEGETGDALGPQDLDLQGLGADAIRPGAPIPEAAPPPSVPGERVVLRGLDKLSGELGEAEAAVGETASLWRLEIDVKACYARPEASSTDASAFVQIRDTKPDPAETVFSGWMFAASPALSAMDHPRYDVWVLSCSVASAETSG